MPDRIELARSLRRGMTDAERLLWRRLRDALPQLKFRRQHPVGPFILDFYCHEHRLGIEVDGGQHFLDEELAKDAARSFYLTGRGISVLRFTNLEVLQETDAVLECVWLEIYGTPASPSP